MVALNYLVAGIFIVLLLVIAFIFLYLQLRRRVRKEDLVEELPIEDTQTIKLHNYIEQNVARGYSPKQVREALLAKGWDASCVEKAFKGIRP